MKIDHTQIDHAGNRTRGSGSISSVIYLWNELF